MRRRAVFAFISPMLATDQKRPFYGFFKEAVRKRGIGAVILDEVEMLMQHTAFRTEVRMIKALLATLKKHAHRKNIRIVGLCATMAPEDASRTESLLGVTFTKMVWATPREMSRRQIRIELEIREPAQVMTKAKESLSEIVESSDDVCAMILTQTNQRVDQIGDSIYYQYCLEEAKEADLRREQQLVLAAGGTGDEQAGVVDAAENIDPSMANGAEQGSNTISNKQDTSPIPTTKDIVNKWSFIPLTGDSPPEAKTVGINLFCRNLPDHPQSTRYRICLMTAGLGCAGVSNPNLRLVVSDGVPDSHNTAVQMAGRLIRGNAIEGQNYRFVVFVSTQGFAQLLRRTYSSDAPSHVINDQVKRHKSVLSTFVYEKKCIHHVWENLFGQPSSEHDTLEEPLPDHCGGNCPVCSPHHRANLFLHVERSRLRSALLNVFESVMEVPMNKFTSLLFAHGVKVGAFLGKNENKPLESKSIQKFQVDALALQLYCAGIVEHTHSKIDGVVQIKLRLAQNDAMFRLVDFAGSFHHIHGVTDIDPRNPVFFGQQQ